MNITRKWKKVLALGCSHGLHADPVAIAAVLKFREQFNPDTCIHLGDFVDTTAFRSGAKGTSDESEPVQPDVDGGLDFLEKLRPTLVFAGNHEDRINRLISSPNAIVSHCAQCVLKEIEATCKKLKADYVPYTGVNQGRIIGDYRYCHGVLYGENATRDHAETFGNIVHAHTHRTGMAKGRRSDRPTGFSVGTLTRSGAMEYAKLRRSTLSWAQGFVFGYYTDTGSQLYLHEHPHDAHDWKLPL